LLNRKNLKLFITLVYLLLISDEREREIQVVFYWVTCTFSIKVSLLLVKYDNWVLFPPLLNSNIDNVYDLFALLNLTFGMTSIATVNLLSGYLSTNPSHDSTLVIVSDKY
jgi:hypothetical protein